MGSKQCHSPNKNICCIGVPIPPVPPTPPTPPTSSCDIIGDELCGNIFIVQNQVVNSVLWESLIDTPVTGTVNIFNDESNSDPIVVQIIGNIVRVITVEPGNTRSVSVSDLQSVVLINDGANASVIHGKYCINVTYYRVCPIPL
ncbi:S-Ena type endospore appendage [Priestia taiwanensis]|uniref:Endospore appendages core domain-containing protein n=1 Tax=Priestia taiwanensis TaxID=1347902 RepID=A0A917EPG8_9BACI|nr:S-Ena type endospore appendage [Priestia taiwanensis]MBM7364058.1 hypothetical protein [Priestia taiwanensis]GGE71267.1 hypothetical protein GCM10007140_21480 [Priestia taiwanensis]